MKTRSVLLFALLYVFAVAAFSQTVFKPGDTIQMTVKFDSAVEPGSNVTVNYHINGSLPSDQQTFGGRFNFQASSPSSDNKTFLLQAKVEDMIASGEYVFGALVIDKRGLLPGESDISPTAPTITIKNPGKDPKRINVPSFSLQVK